MYLVDANVLIEVPITGTASAIPSVPANRDTDDGTPDVAATGSGVALLIVRS